MAQWTAEQAALFSVKGVEARNRNRANRESLPKPASRAVAVQPHDVTDGYNVQRLMRVRKQLNRIDSMMEREDDPQKLDRLASAQARLSEQERILRGEPLPGSRRPAPERKSSRGQSSQGHSAGSFHARPIPQPVASPTPKPGNGI